MSDEGRETGRSLTRGEFDAVIRRAAELASSDPEASESALTEAELFRIAGEVGLSEAHVRLALTEVRAGTKDQSARFVDRVFGPPEIRVSRVVPGTPADLTRQLDDFLVGTQLLQRVRHTANFLHYRPAGDFASQLARGFGSAGKSHIASAKSLEVQLDAVAPDRTLVSLAIEPGTRSNDLGGAIFGGAAAAGAAGVGSAFGLALVAPLALAVGGGAVVGGGLWSLIFFGTGAAHRRKMEDLRSEAEGVLDALESGMSLEPPPPMWRRWMRRHLGAARDILGDEVARGRSRGGAAERTQRRDT